MHVFLGLASNCRLELGVDILAYLTNAGSCARSRRFISSVLAAEPKDHTGVARHDEFGFPAITLRLKLSTAFGVDDDVGRCRQE